MPSRGTTSQFVDIHGHTYLVDAGEGVQLALRRNKRKFQKLKGVFISHMHGDHVLGLPGLLSTMSLLGRREPLPVWGPDVLGPWLDATWHAIQAHMSFEVEFKPWGDGVEVLEEGERHRLVCAPAKHRIPTRALRIEAPTVLVPGGSATFAPCFAPNSMISVTCFGSAIKKEPGSWVYGNWSV